ncbi:hypothetical protein BW33_02259 [Pseudomonas sp. RIT288]|nr:hypothetical protein BW33_02259 [Pseudomonas sp. RIT288]
MQPTFRVEILPLKAQRLVQVVLAGQGDRRDFAVGVVLRRPDDFAAVVGQFLRGAEVVELVIKGAGLFRAFAVEQRQRAEGAGFVDVAAVVGFAAFGDKVVALPEEFGGLAVDGFADAPAEGVVLVGRGLAVGAGQADQAVLAVVAVFGDELLVAATAFADQVAEGVVVVVSVALHQQAVALDPGRAGAFLHQQVAGRVVSERFRQFVTRVAHADQAVEGVVTVGALAVAAVGDVLQIAVGAVGVIAAIQRFVLMTYSVGE